MISWLQGSPSVAVGHENHCGKSCFSRVLGGKDVGMTQLLNIRNSTLAVLASGAASIVLATAAPAMAATSVGAPFAAEPAACQGEQTSTQPTPSAVPSPAPSNGTGESTSGTGGECASTGPGGNGYNGIDPRG